MPVLFAPIPAKPTFGTVQPLLYSSDYLNYKKTRALNCVCYPTNIKPNYNNYYLTLDRRIFRNELNKTNLVYGLYSKENLKYVTPISSNTLQPTAVSVIQPSSVPFYQYYIIDQKGELFGNTQCGENNFVNYMEPLNSTISENILTLS